MEAPLRLIEHVVIGDRRSPRSSPPTTRWRTRPWPRSGACRTTADGEWQVAHYADGRAHAGILSDSFLFTRHSTTFSNKSRGRANLISRALLCYDFLSRGIAVDTGIDLADPEQVANAIENNGACASCHQTLDPLASYFASFYPIYVPADLEQYPFRVYRAGVPQVFSVTEPGYFGQPPRGDVRDVGSSASDRRRSAVHPVRGQALLRLPRAGADSKRCPRRRCELQEVLVDQRPRTPRSWPRQSC